MILVVSVGLGFVNEFRAERAADALHDRVRYNAVVTRDGVRLRASTSSTSFRGTWWRSAVGSVVPADIRLLIGNDLLCDESIVTGESLPGREGPAADARWCGAWRSHELRTHGNHRAVG